MPYRRAASHLSRIALALCLIGPGSLAWAAKCDRKSDVTLQQSRLGLCKFDAQKRAFAGTPAQQAACLTREVQKRGNIGAETITPFLKDLVGTPAPGVQAVQRLLDSRQIKPAEIGGPLGQSIKASYFIIHDTSTPNCSESGIAAATCPKRGEFPPNRDDASWPVNKNFGGHPKKAPNRLAHVFNNRVGVSVTEVDFADHFVTTKFEQCVDADAKTRLFVGIENIQPRIGDPPIPPAGKRLNDAEAPTPGFAPAQYDRLALLYLVASTRRGQWLIPVFHAVLDQMYADGHDDPQRFDMPAFSAAVQKHLDALMPPEGRLPWRREHAPTDCDDVPGCACVASEHSVGRGAGTTAQALSARVRRADLPADRRCDRQLCGSKDIAHDAIFHAALPARARRRPAPRRPQQLSQDGGSVHRRQLSLQCRRWPVRHALRPRQGPVRVRQGQWRRHL
jgi:hypothetical protein